MICYKDRQWCTGDGCKAFDGCPRALTDKVRADARKWWGEDSAPIDIKSEPKKAKCYEE